MRRMRYALILWPAWLSIGSAAEVEFHVKPYLQNVTRNSITVAWETSGDEPSVVEYGPGKSFTRKVQDPTPVKIHMIRLRRLKGNTQYSYRVGGEAGTFRTAPRPGTAFNFALMGDTRNWGRGRRSSWYKYGFDQHFMQWDIRLCVDTGDLVRVGTDHNLWGSNYFPRFELAMRHIPFYPARGNHERSTGTEEARNWFKKYFDLPGGEPYSSFEYADAVFLNISYDRMRGAPDFVRKVLSRVGPGKWKFVYYHYPDFCTGYYDANNKRKAENANKMAAILEQCKVDMVFNGHTHTYERTFSWKSGRRALDNSGVTYLVSGGGVGGQHPDKWSSRMMLKSLWRSPHYQLFRVDGDKLTMTSYAVRRSDEEIAENDYFVLSRSRSYASGVLSRLKRAQGRKALDLIRETGGLCYVPAAETVVKFLRSGSVDVRRTAADALAKIASPKVAGKLIPYLKDRDLGTRRSLADAVGLTHPTGKIVSALAPIVRDENQDPEVRVSLIGGLHHGGDPAAVKLLLALLSSGKERVRQRAAYALKEMGGAKLGIKSELERARGSAEDKYVKKCLDLAIAGKRKD